MISKKDIFGLVRTGVDAHTLGASNIQGLLEDCGFKVIIAQSFINKAIDNISIQKSFKLFKTWVIENKINRIGLSYRLDSNEALDKLSRFVFELDNKGLCSDNNDIFIKSIYFAGLPDACDLVTERFKGRVKVFKGGETPLETLDIIGVPRESIPNYILQTSVYDDLRLQFSKELLDQEKHLQVKPFPHLAYKEYGTIKDHLITRLHYAKVKKQLPLLRAHVGPYLPEREKSLLLFNDWLKKLSVDKFLDIVSIGSSQLTQSDFGGDWNGKANGGGCPINSELEFRIVWESARPMLVRAYSGTKNISFVAGVLEKTINNAWHALSLWWFNKVDGRGPLDMKQGLYEHIETIKYVAGTDKPFEPNVPHHFAFRGADDLTYVVSMYLAAKTAKCHGIKYLVLQNMLNTPRSTIGVQDLAKARVMLKLIRSLEDNNFKVFYQPRAGLDYFSFDPDIAKVQLASVTALMLDVEPDKSDSPEIIHVVSYSEGSYLADPAVINESIQITRAALQYYPAFRVKNGIFDILNSKDVKDRTQELLEESRMFIYAIENNIKNTYTPEGLYSVFKAGYFPVPYLWECRDKFYEAVNWSTKLVNGGMCVVDKNSRKMSIGKRLSIING